MSKKFVLVCRDNFHSNKLLRQIRMMLPGHRGSGECWGSEFQILGLGCYTWFLVQDLYSTT